METHSSILYWEIPLTEEPDGLQSMGLDMTWRQHHHHHVDHLAAAEGERSSRQMSPWNGGQEKLLSGRWYNLEMWESDKGILELFGG